MKNLISILSFFCCLFFQFSVVFGMIPCKIEKSIVPCVDVSQESPSWSKKYSVDALSKKLQGNSDAALSFIKKKNNEKDLAGAVVIMALVPEKERKAIVDLLLPDHEYAQNKFLNMPIIAAVSHYSAAETLSHYCMTKQPVTLFFIKSAQDKRLLKYMYDYFSQSDETAIQISKQQANQIVMWEDAIKQEFKNSKEFFIAEIMPNDSDKVFSLAVAALQGSLYGSAITIAVNVCYNYGKLIEQSRIDAFKQISHVAMQAGKWGAITSLYLTRSPQVAAYVNAVNAWNEAPFILKPGIAIVAGMNGFFTELGRSAVESGMRVGYVHGLNLTKKTLINGISLNLINVSLLRYTGCVTGIGAIANAAYALRTINDPIDVISISKM